MPRNQNTIMDFSWYSLNPFYQFFAFGLMFLIDTRSVKLEDADRTRIEAWIDLKTSFQYWLSWRIFQVCIWFLSAAESCLALGLSSWICSEMIRSRKLNKIHGIDDFTYLISSYLFISFPSVIWCQLAQIKPKLA